MNYRLPETCSIPKPPRLYPHSRFFFFTHQITAAPNLRVALRYFQALELHEVLRVYRHVADYAERHESANPFLSEIEEHLRNYIEYCLTQGWQTFPLSKSE
jgi:hypothetical protein